MTAASSPARWAMSSPVTETPALAIRGLRKSFDPDLTVRDVDLDVEPEAFLGLVWPNGAGKTTLLSMAVGLLRPDTRTGLAPVPRPRHHDRGHRHQPAGHDRDHVPGPDVGAAAPVGAWLSWLLRLLPTGWGPAPRTVTWRPPRRAGWNEGRLHQDMRDQARAAAHGRAGTFQVWHRHIHEATSARLELAAVRAGTLSHAEQPGTAPVEGPAQRRASGVMGRSRRVAAG